MLLSIGAYAVSLDTQDLSTTRNLPLKNKAQCLYLTATPLHIGL